MTVVSNFDLQSPKHRGPRHPTFHHMLPRSLLKIYKTAILRYGATEVHVSPHPTLVTSAVDYIRPKLERTYNADFTAGSLATTTYGRLPLVTT